MGQKVNPIGNRLGIIKGWDSNWYGGKDFSGKLVEDTKIREYLNARLAKASLSKIIIERTLKLITVTVNTARPGIIIGKGGQEVDKLKEELKKITKKEVQINIFEVKRPELDAILASNSGRLTSKMFIWTSFLVIFLSSSFSLSTSCPPFPMIIPGRAVLTVTVISFSVLSIIILERLAFASLALRYSLIFESSTSLPEKSFPPYQFESHPFIMPNLLPIGFTFCPICSNLMFFQLR